MTIMTIILIIYLIGMNIYFIITKKYKLFILSIICTFFSIIYYYFKSKEGVSDYITWIMIAILIFISIATIIVKLKKKKK